MWLGLLEVEISDQREDQRSHEVHQQILHCVDQSNVQISVQRVGLPIGGGDHGLGDLIYRNRRLAAVAENAAGNCGEQGVLLHIRMCKHINSEF